MKKFFIYTIILLCVPIMSGCGDEKKVKDSFIGTWITWDDSQQFLADEYIQDKYLENKSASIDYSSDRNGLFVFNYIIYENDEIKDRVTIASNEMKVDDTEYTDKEIKNHAVIYRGHTLSQNLYLYRIMEKNNGEIYINNSSKEVYYSYYGVEQVKKIARDGYRLDIEFKDIEVIKNIDVTEYTLEGGIVSQYSFDNTTVQNDFKINETTAYIVIDENYIDIEGKQYIKNNYLVFNSNVLSNDYSCYLVNQGIGKKYTIKFSY